MEEFWKQLEERFSGRSMLKFWKMLFVCVVFWGYCGVFKKN